jgi:hypothetical protein
MAWLISDYQFKIDPVSYAAAGAAHHEIAGSPSAATSGQCVSGYEVGIGSKAHSYSAITEAVSD